MSEETVPWLSSFPSVRDWAITIQSPKTKAIYFSHLARYCKFIDKNPDELIQLKLEGMRELAT